MYGGGGEVGSGQGGFDRQPEGEPPLISSFPDRLAARRALAGEQGRAPNRFFRAATSKSIDFKATPLSGGRLRLEFLSPANNPGYGKRYVQEIDQFGNIRRWYQETWGPEGQVNTKWLMGGPG